MKCATEIHIEPDQRGKHQNRQHKISEKKRNVQQKFILNLINVVNIKTDHIKYLMKYENWYENTSRRFLLETVTILERITMKEYTYLQSCQLPHYTRIFYKQMTLNTYYWKKQTCKENLPPAIGSIEKTFSIRALLS